MDINKLDQPGAAAWWVSLMTRLPRYKFLLRKRWWIPVGTIALGLLIAAWRLMSEPIMYMSQSRLMVSGKVSFGDGAAYNEESSLFVGTQLEWMRSDEVQHNATERVLAMNPGIQPVPVKLEAIQIPRTAIFMLTATGGNAPYTQQFLKACVDEYIDARKAMRADKSELALNGLTEQLLRFDKEAKDAEEELQNFQKENNVGFLQEQSSAAAIYLVKLNGQLADMKTEYQLLELLDLDQNIDRKQKNKPADDNGGVAPGGSDSVKGATGAEADYIKARQEIEVLKAKRADLSKVLRPKHPDMIDLNQQIERQESLIAMFRSQTLDQLKSRKESIALQIKNLQNSISEGESKALSLNEKMAEYNRIKSKGDRARSNYEWIQTSTRSVDMSKKIDQEIVSVTSAASPAVTIRPGLWKMIGLGLMGGLITGVIILFMLDKIDDRMNSYAEFQSHFSENVLAKIPDEAGAEDPLSFERDDMRLSFLESMRALRSSIFYLPVEGTPPKTFLVTSAVPNEGKTTVAINLAITMSFAGSRVLLIDGDLRRGSIHEKFGLDNSVGIGDVFKGRVTAKEAARPTKISNLSLMARGANMEHPGESYLGKKADDLLKALYSEFDYIIFDSSPVLVADDTTSLAPKIDAVMVVVRFSFSSARRSREAIELLKKRQANLIGIICNGVDQLMQDYYYNKYPEYYAVKHDA